MNVLVTGGAGFIGSNLVDKILINKYKVYVVDDLSKGKLTNLNKKAEFIKLDINSPKLKKLISQIQPKVIFHLAAQSNLPKSLKNPDKDLKINFISTQKLLEYSKNKIEKFIFASSAAIYKKSDILPIKENFPLEPTSIYGVSKLCSEFIIENYYNRYKLPYTCLRFSNVYGPKQDNSGEGGVVSIFISRLIKNRTIMINGNGNQTRDFIYVDDAVNSLIKSANAQIIGKYNISTGKETTINKLYFQLLKYSNAKQNSRYKALPNLEVPRSALSYHRFSKLTGWKPNVSLKEGILKTFYYFNENL